MAFSFIHTADWQLGKSFGQFSDDQAGLLKEARINAITKIAEVAREHSVTHILVAGDVWDSAIPANKTLRQPLTIMGETPELIWWLLPGNHDPDGSDGLWDRVSALAPDNVRLLRKAAPVEMEAGVFVLSAPWQRIQHGQDLTQWMESAETPDGALRIGLAHGGVKGFGSEGEGDREIIPPNRAERANLDYLALGDWHARTVINPKTHYPGTPEPDRHKSGARGQVLLVNLEQGRDPVVSDISTGQYDWPVISTHFEPDKMDEQIEILRQKLSIGQALRKTHAQLNISGEATLAEWSVFESFIEELSGDCASLQLRGENNINLVVVPEDIDALDAQGSVRDAAQDLLTRRNNPDLSKMDRDVAATALRLLLRYGAETA